MSCRSETLDALSWSSDTEKLAAADFLLIAAGAGFSADSSLPVYAYGLLATNLLPYIAVVYRMRWL